MSLQKILSDVGLDTTSLNEWIETERGAVWTLNVPGGEQGMAIFQRLRTLVEQTGHYPVVLGDASELEMITELREPDTTVKSIMDAAHEQNLESFWESREEMLEEYEDEEGEDEAESEATSEEVGEAEEYSVGEVDLDAIEDTTPSPFDSAWIQGLVDLDGNPQKETTIGLFPTLNHLEVIAFLQYGGWNDCPYPHEHIAVLKKWEREFGAQIVVVAHDLIQVYVKTPVINDQRLVRLVEEQYLYAPDIVDQGTETLQALAEGLVGSPTWFFWWD